MATSDTKKELSPIALAAIGAAFAILAAWIVRIAVDTRGLNVDDAYIHLHIARNWAEGNGPVFNPGERVEASTSPAWIAILALMLKAGLSGTTAAAVLETASAAAAGAIVALIARPAGTRAAILAPLILAAIPAFSIWSASGLETPLAAAALVGTVFLAMRARSAGGVAGVGVCSALLVTVRPEMMALAPVLVGFAAWNLPKESRIKAAIVGGVAFAVPVGSLLLLRHAYYGMWVPNTYVAKVGGSGLEMRIRGIRYVLKFLVMHFPLLVGIALLPKEWRRRYAAPLVVAAGLLAAVAWAGGDHFYYGRLVVPTLPLLCLPLATVIATEGGPRRLIAGALAVVQVPFAIFATGDRGAVLQERYSTRDYESIAYAMNERLPPGSLATIGIGGLAWITHRFVLDMVGLADPVIARSPRFPGAKSGHEHGDADYVMRRAPDFVLLFTWPTEKPVDDAEELEQLSTLTGCCQSAKQLLEHPHFRERYEHFDLPLDTGKHQRMWRKKDARVVP